MASGAAGAPEPAPVLASAHEPVTAKAPVVNPVREFLVKIGAGDTWAILEAEDVVDMETLADMSKEDFRSMGLKLGKISKIQRGLQSGGE
jgi:hypothetical protein